MARADGAGGQDEELPLADVERVVRSGLSAGLHREDEHVGADLARGAHRGGLGFPGSAGEAAEAILDGARWAQLWR